MILKNDVITDGVQPETVYAVGVFEGLFLSYGIELVVTSLVEGIHPASPKQLHAHGYAADLRTRDLPEKFVASLVAKSRSLLFPLGYDVVIEGVSLINNYRTQFREILANKSPEVLLDTLRKKVGKT